MKRFAILLACATLAFGAQATPQQDKMKTCNVDAKGKKGDERKAFMKECLSGSAAASAPVTPAPATPAAVTSAAATPAAVTSAASAVAAACDKSAADKKLYGAAAKSHIKKCVTDAASAPK